MRYSIDAKRKILDFYIMTDYGPMSERVVHDGIPFEDAIKFIKSILQDMIKAIETGEDIKIARIERSYVPVPKHPARAKRL